MPLINEYELKQHPVAVITVESIRAANGLRPGHGMIEFEWFNTVEAANEWAVTFGVFAASDALGHHDDVHPPGRMRAHLIIVIDDTRTMKIGKTHVFPKIRATEEWRDQTLENLTVLFDPATSMP